MNVFKTSFRISSSLRRFTSRAGHKDLYFSGIQPTGIPHLGNYFGFIEPWIELQNSLTKETSMILAVVDQHAISLGPKEPNSLRNDIRRMAIALIACGVRSDRTLLFRQSDVPQIAQLSWILGSLQTVSKLQRLPQYKDKSSKFRKGEVPVGLVTYPLLQAADVLMFKATHVPVGADQSQHMNLLADLAYAFNKTFATELFPIPKQVTREKHARLKSLRDPTEKMSKSSKSAKSRIDVTDSREEIFAKCAKAVSDNLGPIAYDHEHRPAVSSLMDLYAAVSGESVNSIEEWKIDYLKRKLGEAINTKLEPIREEIARLEKTDEIDQLLFENGSKARRIAEENMENIRKVIGFL